MQMSPPLHAYQISEISNNGLASTSEIRTQKHTAKANKDSVGYKVALNISEMQLLLFPLSVKSTWHVDVYCCVKINKNKQYINHEFKVRQHLYVIFL